MSPSTRFLATTALAMSLGPACIPSSTSGRTSTTVDSSPDPKPQPRAEVAPPADPTTGEPYDPSPDPTRPSIVQAPTPEPAPHASYVPQRDLSDERPYRVHVVDESHRDLPTFYKGGRTYVLGTVGARYSVSISNPTSRRVEAVVSVDGLDAVDGHAASYVDKRGYILQPYGDATIDGFRTSFDEVATFRFSSVADSYAGRLGQARDVGVIGVAFFPERAPVYVPPPAEIARKDPPAMPRPTRAAAASSPPAPPASTAVDDLGAMPATSGPAAAHARMSEPSPAKRPGLGTEFGEARESRVQSTEFARANPTTPSQVVAIRYNNRAGLLAMGIALPPVYVPPATEARLRETAEPFRETRFAQAPP